MKIFFVVILVALVFLFSIRSKAPKATSGGIYLLLLLFIIVQGTVLVRGCGSRGPVVIPSFHEVAGKLLGQRIAEEQPGGGIVLVMLDGSLGTPDQPYTKIQEAQLKGLRAAFLDTALSVEELVIQPQDTGIMAMVAAGPPVTEAQFFGMLEERSDATAAVSCFGVPSLATGTRDSLPPLYVLESMHEPEGQTFMDYGMIQGGVFMRSGADWMAKPKGRMSDEEVFAMRYVLVTVGGE